MALTHGGDIYSFLEYFGGKVLDFSANVNPAAVPESVRKAVSQAIVLADQYPDPLCRSLRAALAEHEQLSEDNILCGNGAADLIWRYVRTLKPRKALVTAPTFSEYASALNFEGTTVLHYPLHEADDFQLGEEILERLTEDLDILFLCNPNNPTGISIKPALLDAILERCIARKIKLFVDACFIGFLSAENDVQLRGMLEKSPKVFILKAFTKLYGMPGVRLGYALSTDVELLEQMRLSGPPWAVSSLAQAAGLAALADQDYLIQSLQQVKEERAYLNVALQDLGLKVYPSEANFILFYSEDTKLAEKLQKQAILIRDCSNYYGLTPGYFRIAVRLHEDNLQLISALQSIINH